MLAIRSNAVGPVYVALFLLAAAAMCILSPSSTSAMTHRSARQQQTAQDATTKKVGKVGKVVGGESSKVPKGQGSKIPKSSKRSKTSAAEEAKEMGMFKLLWLCCVRTGPAGREGGKRGENT